jgi:poly(A) polymerase
LAGDPILKIAENKIRPKATGENLRPFSAPNITVSLDLGHMESVAVAMERLATLVRGGAFATLARSFESAGFEFALVGGSVRDAFLGRNLTDIDCTTNADPDEILRVVSPIAKATWDMGRDFGTIGALVDGERIEITTYRVDAYDGKTRKPMVKFGNSVDVELERRYFTINSLALRLP